MVFNRPLEHLLWPLIDPRTTRNPHATYGAAHEGVVHGPPAPLQREVAPHHLRLDEAAAPEHAFEGLAQVERVEHLHDVRCRGVEVRGRQILPGEVV
jgi:hypothetical protein